MCRGRVSGWCSRSRRAGAVGRKDSDAQLDHFQEVNVTPQCLIMIVYSRGERADGARDDAWEFGVLQMKLIPAPRLRREDACHCDVGILIDQLPEILHLLCQVALPHIAYPGLFLIVGSAGDALVVTDGVLLDWPSSHEVHVHRVRRGRVVRYASVEGDTVDGTGNGKRAGIRGRTGQAEPGVAHAWWGQGCMVLLRVMLLKVARLDV